MTYPTAYEGCWPSCRSNKHIVLCRIRIGATNCTSFMVIPYEPSETVGLRSHGSIVEVIGAKTKILGVGAIPGRIRK